MKLFEYAVLYVPPQNQNESKKPEEAKLLVAPKHCLAADLASAQIIAARAIPEEYVSKLQNVQLAVRPF